MDKRQKERVPVWKKYIDQDFYIFPCLNIKNPKDEEEKIKDKSPAIRGGFYSASNDLETVKRQFYKEDFLVGFPTGKRNGIAVIDIDINKKIPGTDDIDPRSVDELKEALKENYGELPDTYMVETKNGGRHYYYLLPEGIEISSRNRYFDDFLSIDVKGNGGYVIAADGENYIVYDDAEDLGIDKIKSRCAHLPQWIIDSKNQSTESTYTQDNILPASEIKEIRSALSYLSSDDRDLWIKIGMALKSTGSISAYGLFNEWSKTSSKYNPEDMEQRWATLKPNDITIASLFHLAEVAGWVTTYDKVYKTFQESQKSQIPDEQKIKEKQKEFTKNPFPTNLLNPGGLVGDIINYILEKSIMPQPVFALSTALCAVGTLAGRKVQTETGIRTNLYCLNVGASGCGKEAPREIIQEIFEAAKCGQKAAVEDLASDVAITTELSNLLSQMFLIDEIGRFLEVVSKKNVGSHLSKIVDVLLKYYGSAKKVVYGKSYADKDKKVRLVQPNLCLLGSTVPEKLYRGLDYDSVTNGFLSRMLIFETDNNRPRKQRGKNFLSKPPQDLISRVKALNKKPTNMNPQGNLDGIDDVSVPDPQIVHKNENATDMLYDFDDHIDNLRDDLEEQNRVESIYNRIPELAEKIALIVSVGINFDEPVITENEMSYGICIANHLAEHMQFVVENYMAKNEHEHEVKRILKIIRTAGCISLQKISKNTQNLHGSIRNDILETLKTSGQIRGYSVGTGIHTKKMFTAL